jgi:SET domain-containing protein
MSYILNISFIIILIFFVILTSRLYYLNIKYLKHHDKYFQSKIYIEDIKGKGRGVFANQDYKKGEIIEICPCIKIKDTELPHPLKDYVFNFNTDDALVGFGYCSIYNDSKKPNAFWEIIDENKIRVVAKENIKKGDEICQSYGR